MNPWSAWSVCSQKCGSGNQTRERTIKTLPLYGGTPCPTNLKETQSCQDNSQCPTDCQVEWKPEGSCSATCGFGNQKYMGTIIKQPQFNGNPCPTILTKNEKCENYSGCTQDNTLNNTPSKLESSKQNNSLIIIITIILLIIPIILLL
jgi:hypothetical protein